MGKKTLVLGASTNLGRYSNLAVHRLMEHGHEVVPVGIKAGTINGIEILTGQPEVADIDTVTLYLNPERQSAYYEYIFKLRPKRIIFNPGTENMELIELAQQRGIETEVACNLVMLSVGNY